MFLRRLLPLCIATLPALTLADDAPVPVTVTQAKLLPVVSKLELTGTVTAKRQSRLSSRTSGLIMKLHVDAGSVVKTGDVLMELDDTQAKLALERLQVENEQATTELAEAKRQLEEVSALTKVGGFSKSEAETRQTAVRVKTAAVSRSEVQMREQKDIIARHQLLAPFDGVIRNKQTEEGEWVQTGTPVVELVETGDVLLDVQVPQEFYTRLASEVTVAVRLDALPQTELKATISTSTPVKDPVSRTFLLRLKLDDPKGLALPGMSARIVFRFRNETASIQVPRDAIVRTQDGGATVWSLEPDENGTGIVKAQSVTLGASSNDQAVIQEGLAQGTLVVLLGNESLREGQKVKVVK